MRWRAVTTPHRPEAPIPERCGGNRPRPAFCAAVASIRRVLALPAAGRSDQALLPVNGNEPMKPALTLPLISPPLIVPLKVSFIFIGLVMWLIQVI